MFFKLYFLGIGNGRQKSVIPFLFLQREN